MGPLFAADSIGKSFGARTVLKAASVWGEPGKITVLFGRNGCGKSTLLKVGAGLLRADHGVVRFDGHAWLRPRLPELAAHGLYYLPDRGLLSPRFSVREQLRAVEWRFGGRRSGEILERLDLSGLVDRSPDRLSGGERRRAEIAVAWVRAPRCLLADEPFLGLNPAAAESVAGAFREIATEGRAVILTGHEVPQLLEIADEVVWMTAGTTHGLGPPARAASHEQFRREYLGPARPASLLHE